MKKTNTYIPTDVTTQNKKTYSANLHAKSLKINQIIWDMIKILDKLELYGFHFEAKIGSTRTFVILMHEDEVLLEEAKKRLKFIAEDEGVVLLSKVKKKKSSKAMWIILGIILAITVIFWVIFNLYGDKILSKFKYLSSTSHKIEKQHKPIVEKIVEVDIEKLKALKDSFSESNNALDPKVFKAMDITTSIISSMVSDEEKAKYSSKDVVKNFKGKSGFKFVLKDGNLSKDFNATVAELNGYAMHFVKESNLSLATKFYDRALAHKEITKEELIVTLAHQGELFEKMGDINTTEVKYRQILKLLPPLVKKDFEKYAITNALVLSKIKTLINNSKIEQKLLVQSDEIYKKLLAKLRKKAKKGKEKNQIHLGMALNIMANFYAYDKKDFNTSISLREEAIGLYRVMSKKKKYPFTLLHYKSLNSLGRTYQLMNKSALAFKNYLEALDILKPILEKKTMKNYAYLALSYRILSQLKLEDKDFKSAKIYYKQALDIYQRLFTRNISNLHRVYLIEMEKLFAKIEAKRGELSTAKRHYKKAIHSYKKLNQSTHLKYNLEIAKTLNDLALLDLENKPIEAGIELHQAIALAKKSLKIDYRLAQQTLAKSYAYRSYLAYLEEDRESASRFYRMSRVRLPSNQ